MAQIGCHLVMGARSPGQLAYVQMYTVSTAIAPYPIPKVGTMQSRSPLVGGRPPLSYIPRQLMPCIAS